MKKSLFICFAIWMALGWTIGCHAQVAPNPTVTTYSCPASTGTAYTPLNQTSPATGLTYQDSKPTAGTYCYLAQSVGTPGQYSAPSNTAGPFTTSGTNSVNLSWLAPTTGTTPTGYVLSRAPATVTTSTVFAPSLGAGTVAKLHDPSTPMLSGTVSGQ